MADEISDFKKLLAAHKLVLGTEETIKKARQGKVSKIYLAANCEQTVKKDITHLCKISNLPFVELSQTNEEIGVICKKPFAISVIGAV